MCGVQWARRVAEAVNPVFPLQLYRLGPQIGQTWSPPVGPAVVSGTAVGSCVCPEYHHGGLFMGH